MKARTLKPFNDLKEGVTRNVGEVFRCSKERFEEIDTKIPGYIEAVEEPKRQNDEGKQAEPTDMREEGEPPEE